MADTSRSNPFESTTNHPQQYVAQQYASSHSTNQNMSNNIPIGHPNVVQNASGAMIPTAQQPTQWSVHQTSGQQRQKQVQGGMSGNSYTMTREMKGSMFDPLAAPQQQIPQQQQMQPTQQQGQPLQIPQQAPFSMVGTSHSQTVPGMSSVMATSGMVQQPYTGVIQQPQQQQTWAQPPPQQISQPNTHALSSISQAAPQNTTSGVDDDPFGIFSSEKPPAEPVSMTPNQPQPSLAPPLKEIQTSDSDVVSVVSRSTVEGSSPRIGDGPERQLQPPSAIYGQEQRNKNENYAPPPPPSKASVFSEQLAQTAPSDASPLPSYAAVRHSGFVLSRISFRSILLKKWKQTFWIQYGPHQLLFFRSVADYEDWLYNPYHTQTQRDFLVKLKVDFVTDLSKNNVKGYQVTGIRLKAYKRKIMRQFKLERWMEYGPTIAAAFASTETHEVDNLRRCISGLINESHNGHSYVDVGSDQDGGGRVWNEGAKHHSEGVIQDHGGISSRRRRTETEEIADGNNAAAGYLPIGLSSSNRMTHAQSTPNISSAASLGALDEQGWEGGDSVSIQSAADVADQNKVYRRNQSMSGVEF